MKKYGVLFVCTGNICRSPTAEGVFRHLVRENGLAEGFHIDSAGTQGYHIGEPPDRRAVMAAAARGIDISDLRARQIGPRDFEEFNLILALDAGHYSHLERMIPSSGTARLSMFMDMDVPDPYYGQARDFEHVLDLVEKGADYLLRHLQKEG